MTKRKLFGPEKPTAVTTAAVSLEGVIVGLAADAEPVDEVVALVLDGDGTVDDMVDTGKVDVPLEVSDTADDEGTAVIVVIVVGEGDVGLAGADVILILLLLLGAAALELGTAELVVWGGGGGGGAAAPVAASFVTTKLTMSWGTSKAHGSDFASVSPPSSGHPDKFSWIPTTPPESGQLFSNCVFTSGFASPWILNWVRPEALTTPPVLSTTSPPSAVEQFLANPNSHSRLYPPL